MDMDVDAVSDDGGTQQLLSSDAKLSAFETLITRNPPILESLLAQIPTESILRLYHTSFYLRQFLRNAPTAWLHISWRLSQPSNPPSPSNNGPAGTARQPSNYALDQLLINVINPYSTRLASLELDNTSVSGGTLTQTVLVLRRDTLQHLSVRGCKNVSLKYHINPWLQLHALAKEQAPGSSGYPYEKLALRSLYTYRCRHHRRRPYLPSSLVRKESDSEPTHELVKTCHTLGIWTDTAWCTTPGARCYRRRGYVTMRVPQDPREVWVVYDRLWRSKNWLGPTEPQNASTNDARLRKRKRDCRFWEYDEEAANGEPIGTQGDGKSVRMHLRDSHQKFVDNVTCHNCSEPIHERCEQCSVMMHCSGCRKTLCASCAFDRPYLRNKNALPEDRNKFWWAPGCAVSPCSMQDQDPPSNVAANGPTNRSADLPNIKFRWCCTEPVFSGGGGITFGNSSSREADRIRAAPLPAGQGWEDEDFAPSHANVSEAGSPLAAALAGRWPSLDDFFRDAAQAGEDGSNPSPVPRILCDECHASEQWKVKCKGCTLPLCLKHDVKDRMKVRICGYKDLAQEKQEFKSRQKALKIIGSIIQRNEAKAPTDELPASEHERRASPMALLDIVGSSTSSLHDPMALTFPPLPDMPAPAVTESIVAEAAAMQYEVGALLSTIRTPHVEIDRPGRPLSRSSNSSGPASRSSSPAHSASSPPATPRHSPSPKSPAKTAAQPPAWRGCQAFFCPAIRPAGDHRRRCIATMRQCSECKTNACGECVTKMDPPCSCRGCRVSHLGDAVAQNAAESPLFFCPTCRWDRMLSGKCQRRPAAFVRTQASGPKRKRKTRGKHRPLAGRVTHAGTEPADDAMEGLADFFGQLDTQFREAVRADRHDSDFAGDIREIEDADALAREARDIVRRIQNYRGQLPPDSEAALALPNIRLEEQSVVNSQPES